MDKTLLHLLCAQAMNSARDLPNDERLFGSFDEAAELATAKLWFVFDFVAATPDRAAHELTHAMFKVYAGQARECLRRSFADDPKLRFVYGRADALLESASADRLAFEEEPGTVGVAHILRETGHATPVLLAFNVLFDIAQADPPIHSQLREAVARLEPLARLLSEA